MKARFTRPQKKVEVGAPYFLPPAAAYGQYLGAPPGPVPYLGPPPGPVYPELPQVGAKLFRYYPSHGQWAALSPKVSGLIAVESYAATCKRIADVAAADPGALLYVELYQVLGGVWIKTQQESSSFVASQGHYICLPTAQALGR